MSDTTNALSGSSGANSGLINAIAHPTVVNPLAAYQSALQVAKSDYEVQQLRANKAIGDILQQSTDENGNVNYETAGRLAAAAGPVVQSGMQTYLRNASELRGQQLEQGLARNKAASNAIIGALNGDDAGLHDRVVSGLQGLVSNGAMTQEQATRSALSLPSDPTQLRQRLQQIQTQLAPPDLQQEQTAGQRVTISTPQGTYVTTVPPTRQGGTTTVLHGPTPGETSQVSVPMDDQGLIPQDANGVPARTPKTWQTITVPRTAIPGVPQGGSPTYTPPSVSSASPPGTPAPGTVPSPGRINPVPPAGSPLRNSAVATPTATPPSQSGGNAVPGGNTPIGVARTGPPQGQPEQIEQDQKLYGADVGTMPDMQRRAVAGKAALDALSLVGGTGPMSDKFTRIYAFLQGQGIDPGVNPNDYGSTAAYQVLAKNLLRFAQDSSTRSGTDLGLTTQLHSNANAEDMLPAANRHVLIQDMGLLRQKMAMVKGQEASGSGYRERTKNFPTDTDPNAFAWDIMSPPERQSYYNSIKDNPKARAKWEKSMQIAKDNGVWASQP